MSVLAQSAAPTTAPALGRASEAKLLAFAVVLAGAAQVSVALSHDGGITAWAVERTAVFAILMTVAHVAVRRLAPHADPLILPVAAMLNGLGLAVIGRIDLGAADRAKAFGSRIPSGYASLQLVWTAVGIGVFITVLMVIKDHRVLARYGYTAAFLGLILLLLPAALPASISEVNGSKVWIRLSGFSIQPGEFGKLALLLFFAAYLNAKRDVLALVSRSFMGIALPRGRDLGPILLAWLVSVAILVVESDLGQSLLFFGAFITLLYVATERTSWVAIGLVLFTAGAVFAYSSFGHVRTRFDIWLHPFATPLGSGYQLVQGLFGFATGGVLGTGLGRGQPNIVPFSRTDFIIAAIGEELGLVGVIAVLTAYMLMVARGMRAALTVRDGFGRLMACGLAVSIVLQVFVVVGGVMRVIPLTGLTLPFLSYGGSSLVANYALIAVLLRISHQARAEAIADATAAAHSTRPVP